MSVWTWVTLEENQALCRGRSSTSGAGETWSLFLALSLTFWVKQSELLHLRG